MRPPQYEEPGFPRMTTYERYACRDCVSFTWFDDGSARYRTCMEGHHYKTCPVAAAVQEELEAKRDPCTPVEEQLVAVLKAGPLTRDELVKAMGTPRTTVFDGAKKLIMRNEIKKYKVYETERSRGRPRVLFALVGDQK